VTATPQPSPSPRPSPTATPKPTPAPSPSAPPATALYTPQPADVALGSAAVPAPFDPSLPLGTLGTSTLPNAYASVARALPRGFARRRSAGGAAVGANDHESAGIFTTVGYGPPYNAFFATQTAYEASQLPFPYPAGATGEEHIFAPTTHMGWGNCLEDSTYYNSLPTGQTAHFTVYNFCSANPAFIFDTAIDARFLANYVRIGPNGLPAYAVETFTPDPSPAANSIWYTVLYNYKTARYDLIVSASASSAVNFTPSGNGWSIVELYAAPGPCPLIAPSSATNIAFHNTALRTWLLQQPTMTDFLISYFGLEGGSTNPCFNGAGLAPPALQFSLTDPNWSWTVTSP
jgi:hypothetical protein